MIIPVAWSVENVDVMVAAVPLTKAHNTCEQCVHVCVWGVWGVWGVYVSECACECVEQIWNI